MDNNAITYYTLDQAREILREEARQKRIARQKREAKRKAKTIYFLKQKMMGIALIIISILIPIINNGDATASLLFLPLGIYVLFTKERVIMWKVITHKQAIWVM